MRAAFLLVAVLDLVVAWALDVVLKPAGQRLALLAAILRVAYAAAFAATVSTLLIAARWVWDGTLTGSVGLRQADAHALAAVDTFNTGWGLVLTIFGVHLLVLGHAVIRAIYVPTLIGVLVMVSGAGYVIDGLGSTVSGGYHLKIGAFAFIGEVVLMVWLLWAGHKLRETPS